MRAHRCRLQASSAARSSAHCAAINRMSSSSTCGDLSPSWPALAGFAPIGSCAEPWNVSRRVSVEVGAADAAGGTADGAAPTDGGTEADGVAGTEAADAGVGDGRAAGRTGPRRIVSSDARYAATYTPQRGQRSPVTSAAPQRGQASGTGGLEQRGQRAQRVAQTRPVPG
jgi:hypothetical protein